MIQPHGILVAVDPARDFAPVAVSANAATLPGGGAAPHRRSLAELLGADFENALRRRCAEEPLTHGAPWHTALDAPVMNRSFDVTCHASAGHVLVELEPADQEDAGRAVLSARHLQHAIATLRAETGSFEALCASVLRGIRRLTGYERALVYRFGVNPKGHAVAEDSVAGWPHSLVGRHLPAFELCARTGTIRDAAIMRWVVSGEAPPVALLRAPGFEGAIDLSHATLLSLLPVHRRCHRSMGVDGALSLTIHADGEPWGLIICHHRRSHRVSAGERAAAAALADAFGLRVARQLRAAATEALVGSLRQAAAAKERAWQNQTMEAVGKLSGGLAHDMNSLLGGITGSLELALTRLTQGRFTELDRYIDAASTAAQRAGALMHQLLAFSRRQTLDPKPADVNRIVAAMEAMAGAAAGPAITVECVTSAGLWTVVCDTGQLENALLNLAHNARDAMPAGGKLTIEATNARIDDTYAAQFGVPAGHYVAISVSDTGFGMNEATASRAFDPFFTTKPLGKGTGLGLSMVYGFAKQSGGHARIYSEPGHGTTVRLYLPRYAGTPESGVLPAPIHAGSIHAAPEVSLAEPSLAETPMAGALEPAATAIILVVDDEPLLRMLMAEVLEERGFSVLMASSATEAIGVLEASGPLDLLVTDVGLPGGRNGRQVAEAARAGRPGLKVLFITGYAENAALDGGVLNSTTHVLTKPFSMEALAAKVGAMLVL